MDIYIYSGRFLWGGGGQGVELLTKKYKNREEWSNEEKGKKREKGRKRGKRVEKGKKE